ncbi:MAG: glycosyltransferase family 4 protein [Polyangiales bacterium]|nr:glycosyltransferase family 4 protein [Myxococcales bacterium]MCB9656299.1 glycosyltransferase family 4 protein [Sandaracinaceae bacterium]
MRVAYLVNQYPKVSHTFIRRELQALELQGVEVLRYSVRRVAEPLTDQADRDEAERTRVILDGGPQGLAAAMARVAAKRPAGFARASAMAARVGVGSERGVVIHGAYLGEASVLLEWLEEAGVDHVHAHFGTNSTTVAMLVAALGGPGYSFHVHGPEEFDKPAAIALGEKVERSRFVCAISHFGCSQLYRQVSYAHWPKVHVVRCGVEPAFLSGDGRDYPTAPRLVSVGRLSEQKGQILLIEALGQLAREGAVFELVLVGDGEMRADIEAAIAQHGLTQRVHITGWASGPEVREHLLAARAMVLPSFAEGLPVVIMEALGLGRPVLSTYVAGIPELVVPGRNGWLVPAGSVPHLVSALRDVLATPTDTLAAMGAAGREAVLARHDVRVTAHSLAELLYAHVPGATSSAARAPSAHGTDVSTAEPM